MNPRNKDEFRRLTNAVKESFRKMQPFRERRKELLTAFVGSEYSDDGEAKKVYLHLLTMAVNIYVRNLVVRAPCALVTTPHRELRPMAANFALACKDAAEEVDLGGVLRQCATDALFSPRAVVKIGLEFLGKDKYQGVDVDVTRSFVRKVSFDDYVIDMSARSAGRPAFEGDRYYLGKAEFKRRFPGAWETLGVTESTLGMQNAGGEDRAEALSHSQGVGDDDLKGRVAMWDVYLPDDGLVVTWAENHEDKPLDVIELDAPEEGLYRGVWFTNVPDNAMAMPPLAALKNIHNLANSMFRRLASQAQKQKRVVGFSDEESATRFSAAHDGEGVFWNGQKPEQIEIGGIDQVVLAAFIQVKDLFSWTAGNLDSLGGLSPMAETAKQDEMLSHSANAMLADMQDAMTEFARSIFRQVAWYEWTDPIRVRSLQKEIPGTGEFLPVSWTPEARQGDFIDFNFNINPYSMRDDGPGQKIRKLEQVLLQFYGPMQPFFQMQGLTVDVRRLNELIADYSNLPELGQLIVAADPNAMQPTGEGPKGTPVPSTKPMQTKRVYERVNRPGATRAGKDAALMQTLLGGEVQPSVAAAAGRSVG